MVLVIRRSLRRLLIKLDRLVNNVFLQEMRKAVNEEITETEEELNQIENLKVRVLKRQQRRKEWMS
jgi:HAMP domain-containing protein